MFKQSIRLYKQISGRPRQGCFKPSFIQDTVIALAQVCSGGDDARRLMNVLRTVLGTRAMNQLMQLEYNVLRCIYKINVYTSRYKTNII